MTHRDLQTLSGAPTSCLLDAPPAMMVRTFVFKLKPTAKQAAGLERCLRVTRDVYNAALEQRITTWRAVPVVEAA